MILSDSQVSGQSENGMLLVFARRRVRMMQGMYSGKEHNLLLHVVKVLEFLYALGSLAEDHLALAWPALCGPGFLLHLCGPPVLKWSTEATEIPRGMIRMISSD